MPGARLTKAERRDQLLEAAAELILERGLPAVTMEGVAARSGVSKALPYAHFDNAEDILRALYARELARLGDRIVAAVEQAEGVEAKLRAATRGYFDVVAERAKVFDALLHSGALRFDDTLGLEGPRFIARILRHEVGLDRSVAAVAGGVIMSGASAAVGSWARREATREVCEDIVVRMAVAGVGALADEGPAD